MGKTDTIGVWPKIEANIICRHQSKKVVEDCFRMRGEDEMPHIRRELNLLVARFHNDFSFGSTDVFFVPSDCDKEGAMMSGEETNASFHSDGSTKTGSSPMSSDRIDVCKRASSSSPPGGAAVP